MTIPIRGATAGDGPALLAFWRLAAHGQSVSDDLAGVTRLLSHDPDAVLVAETDGEIVGTAIAGWDGWRGHLYRLAVHPAHRRRGVARALLAAAEQRWVRLGARRADAMVDDGNDRAHHLYQTAGYQRQDAWARWVRPLSHPGDGARPGRGSPGTTPAAGPER